MANPKRDVSLLDLNSGKASRLKYNFPEGKVVYDGDIDIPGYSGAKAQLVIREHATPFQLTTLPLREGILVKSGAAIHDCTYFQLETEPYSMRFSGELVCEYVDKLIREYDNREDSSSNHPSNNPILLLDPDRDGLVSEHPFTQMLYKQCRQILKTFIDTLKSSEAEPKRHVTDEALNRKLDNLSKEVSKLFEKKLKELDEETAPGSIAAGDAQSWPLGLHIIPPGEEPIVVNTPKVFTVRIVGFDALDETLPVTVESSNPAVKVRTSPVFLKKMSEDRKTGFTTFTLESDAVGAESIVEVNYNGYDNVILISVEEPPPPAVLPDGLSFEKSTYQLQLNKEKAIYLWLKTESDVGTNLSGTLKSSHPDVVVKSGGQCHFRMTDFPGIYKGRCTVLGRRTKVKAAVEVALPEFGTATTQVFVEEKKPSSRIKLEFEPDEDDFGSVRYKWDEDKPYLLKIAAKHPSIRQYLGTPVDDHYPGIDSPQYVCLLAEVVAEALAFDLLEKQFKTEGQQGMLDYTTVDASFHKHYSDFLAVCHQTLNPQPQPVHYQHQLL